MLILGIIILISGRQDKMQRADSVVEGRSFMRGREMILWKLKVVLGHPLSYTSGEGII